MAESPAPIACSRRALISIPSRRRTATTPLATACPKRTRVAPIREDGFTDDGAEVVPTSRIIDVRPVEEAPAPSGPLLGIVGERGNIVLPAALRRRHGLEAGCAFIIEEDGDAIVIRPAEIFGVIIPPGLSVTVAVPADQVKSLDWRARRADLICKLPAVVVDDILMKVRTLLGAGRTVSSTRPRRSSLCRAESILSAPSTEQSCPTPAGPARPGGGRRRLMSCVLPAIPSAVTGTLAGSIPRPATDCDRALGTTRTSRGREP